MRRIGVGVEVVKGERRRCRRVSSERRGALHLAGRDDPAIGDEQRARERQLARQLAEPRERAVAEHDARAQLKVEWRHGSHRGGQPFLRSVAAPDVGLQTLPTGTASSVRMIRLPRDTAGVASVISSSEFLPSTLNSGPAWIT